MSTIDAVPGNAVPPDAVPPGAAGTPGAAATGARTIDLATPRAARTDANVWAGVRRNRNLNFKRISGGFTLVESLIASVVLATSVMGMSSVLVAANQQARNVRLQMQAVELARAGLEETAAMPIDSLRTLSGEGLGAVPGTAGVLSDQIVVPDPSGGNGTRVYRRTIRIEPLRRPVTTVVSARSTANLYPETATPEGDLSIIRVTIASPSGPSITLSRLAARRLEAQ